MPIVFVAALAGSLIVHVAALFGTDIDLSGPPEPLTLSAELKPLTAADLDVPAPPPVLPKPPRKPKSHSTTQHAPSLAPAQEAVSSVKTEEAPPVVRAVLPPAKPLLSAKGAIRYAVYKTSLGMQIGRSEHQWEFAEDGTYTLRSITETTGIAAVFKPTRIEQESRGRMAAGGLQPEHFTTLKNGRETNENADFDWSTAEIRLARDASVLPMSPGSQDILSLNFQLAYLGRLVEGVSVGVATGKKYDRYAIDSLGEEEIEVPAGRFRTLHVRVQTETTTEIWIALEQRGLPVKIRFTDKKGDSFEQVATEIGMP
jgi:hypothetical protein